MRRLRQFGCEAPGVRNVKVFDVLSPALVFSLVAATAATAAQPAAKPAPVAAATPHELSSLIGGGRWTIVEFGGEACIPCQAMQPTLQELQRLLDDRVAVRNFGIQQHPQVARAHKIMVMPTQLVFNPKGEEVLRHMGVFPFDEFCKALAEKGVF